MQWTLPPPDERRSALLRRFPQWPGVTIPHLFDRVAALYPDRPMILTGARCSSYSDAAAASAQMASGLVAMGLAPGARVAVMMANYPEFIFAKLAIARAGCVAVPVNFLLQRAELLYVLGQSGCRALFGMAIFRDRDYLADFAAALVQLPELQHVFLREDDGAFGPGMMSVAQLAEAATPASDAACADRQVAARADDLCDIVYTSGTTGQPKGAMLTHDMVLRAGFSSALTRAFEDGRRIQFALPMYHVFGYVECWVAPLFVGGAIIPHAVFDPEAMLDSAVAFGATDIIAVPMMTHALIDAARRREGRIDTLRAFFNSGGANSATVWADIRAVLGAQEIHTAYGMTETTASVMCTLGEDPERRLCTTNGGYKLAGPAGDPAIGGRIATYRVVDPETGAVLPCGQDGELQVRGPVVTTGYFGKPDETAAAFTTDGWFRTGDVGRLFADGYLRLTGRIKETYRCGGEMVMPREIEDLLAGVPGIDQVHAVGVPDARMGEVGCLCVVPAAGARIDAAELIARCRSHLARFKVPQHVLILRAEDIPLTVTGRPQKFRLAALAAARLGVAAAAD